MQLELLVTISTLAASLLVGRRSNALKKELKDKEQRAVDVSSTAGLLEVMGFVHLNDKYWIWPIVWQPRLQPRLHDNTDPGKLEPRFSRDSLLIDFSLVHIYRI